jgi:hypothetical protein
MGQNLGYNTKYEYDNKMFNIYSKWHAIIIKFLGWIHQHCQNE